MSPPFVPILKNEYDTWYFENIEEIDPWWVPENDESKGAYKKENKNEYTFLGFTLKK